MKRCWTLLHFICWGALVINAQLPQQKCLLDRIAFHADVMVNADESKHRVLAHDIMKSSLDSLMSLPGSFDISLDSIPWLSVLKGEDFRIVTWQLRISDQQYKYGGYVQSPESLVTLNDNRPWLNGSLRSTYTPASWYGALYYQIIPFDKKNNTYILFGFNAEDEKVNTKVVDVIDFSTDQVQFGLPVFIGKEEPQTRLILTYADVSSVQLFYDTEQKAIVHDHLLSLAGVGPSGEALLVSDGSQEGWLLKNDSWVYKEMMYDVKVDTPPMTDDRKDRKEDKDILGRPRKD